MRFLLDTNTLSETVKRTPDPSVDAWFREQRPGNAAVSAMSMGEIRKGLARLGPGERKGQLGRWLYAYLPKEYAGNVLPIDQSVAIEWGRLAEQARRTGRPLDPVDGLIVATARVRGLTLVSRNARHCAGWGARLFNPWSGKTIK
jgi:predicted nucleic acid-binding protein